MGDFLFEQLSAIRSGTLAAVQGVSESQADLVPEGFNNSIRWNLGHIYSAQEQFAFGFAQDPVLIPDGFRDLFGKGSKPSEWTIQPPTLPELLQLMKEQPNRIREKLSNRLDEKVANPFTIGSLTMNTIGDFLMMSVYHEGMHVQSIKTIKKFSEK